MRQIVDYFPWIINFILSLVQIGMTTILVALALIVVFFGFYLAARVCALGVFHAIKHYKPKE